MKKNLSLNDASVWLSSQREAMLGLLEEIVNIDSGSYDQPGVDAVGVRLERFFAENDVQVSRHQGEKTGGTFTAEVPGTASDKHVLLLGHRDTVFPAGEAARRPFKIVGTRAYGPGVADMKAGLVMNAFVLAAYRKFGGLSSPLIGLFTTDEEIGSPQSRSAITAQARGARAVFNAEPARPNGNVVTGRKGGTFLRMRVHGRAAHSGVNFSDGISAIGELAHKIIALHGLTDLERGITLNVGVVSGGQSVNTVAAEVEALIDLRYLTQSDRADAISRINAIAAHATVSGTTAELDIQGEFDAFVSSESSKQLFSIYQKALADLGVTINGEFSGGCSDSGITSELGRPTVCAIGPVGGKVHTPDEFLEVDSIVVRAQGLALAISRC